jgi:hypothetical protein
MMLEMPSRVERVMGDLGRESLEPESRRGFHGRSPATPGPSGSGDPLGDRALVDVPTDGAIPPQLSLLKVGLI